MAAVCHLHASCGRHGSKSLHRANRALKGWRRLAPGQSRKAFPLAVWSAICVEMVRQQQVRMALFTILGLASYARPSELLSACRVFSLVPPTPMRICAAELGHPSKTNEFDDSLLLDTPYLLPWAPTLLKELRAQPRRQPLWDFMYSDYSHVFSQAAKSLNVEVTPYHLRHSGPSIDGAATSGRCWKRRREVGGRVTKASPGTSELRAWRPTSKNCPSASSATAFTPNKRSGM